MVKLSGSARYLLTVGVRKEGSYSLDMWLWTYGNDEPDGMYVCTGWPNLLAIVGQLVSCKRYKKINPHSPSSFYGEIIMVYLLLF